MERPFRIHSPHSPAGDQPEAIRRLVDGLQGGADAQVLLGVTGSGKTYTVANVVERVQRPTLILAPNKTLAAQLYAEFRDLFPENAVEYFVSYYDYYQPEAYIPTTDTYIEKDSSINERIDRLRHSATRSVLSRRDVICVASVSCIYGLGSPDAYSDLSVELARGQELTRKELLYRLTLLQYRRNDFALGRGAFRARGDVVDIFPVYEDTKTIRVEFWGDEIEQITVIDPLTGEIQECLEEVVIRPGSHFVQPQERILSACDEIEAELEERIEWFRDHHQPLEAQRIEQRTRYDLEMLREVGFCHGIENYSRFFDQRREGEPPYTLLDYFPPDFLLVVDESHVAVPQVGGMYRGDRARKQTLVEYGFRLPSALDNRPLKGDEFETRIRQRVYVSATPADFEIERADGQVVEMVCRPTGLLDPEVDVRPARRQVDDLLAECRRTIEEGYRVLVTTLTKRMAEELTDYMDDTGIRVRYLHSDIDALKRMELLRDLRLGVFDVLVGINLLREGLDLPEVALVAILDADREGFLRSETSLIQTFGRAARNAEGRVILYADRMTRSMERAIRVTQERRQRQAAFNEEHGIVPRTVMQAVRDLMTVPDDDGSSSSGPRDLADVVAESAAQPRTTAEADRQIADLRERMFAAAKDLEFERAAELRDEILRLEKLAMTL